MKIKTAELKSHLCRYLARVRTTGETIVILDRDTPVATLGPVRQAVDGEWATFRAAALARAAKLGLEITIPARKPHRACMPRVRPSRAADGRTDVATVDLTRQGREY